MSRQSGHTVIEFSLVFPLFLFLCISAFQLGLVAVQQFGLERACVQTARLLALSSFPSSSQLTAEARHHLASKEPLQIQVQLRSLPMRPLSSPYRAPKNVEVIELTIEKKVHHLTLRARVHEVRVRAREGA